MCVSLCEREHILFDGEQARHSPAHDCVHSQACWASFVLIVYLCIALTKKCPQCFLQFGGRSVAKRIARNLGADSCCEVALEKCTNLLLYCERTDDGEIRFPDAFAPVSVGTKPAMGAVTVRDNRLNVFILFSPFPPHLYYFFTISYLIIT